MRKNLLILTAVLAVSYSCSNDEIVEVNQGEAINFRPALTGVTRATNALDVTLSNISPFAVTAYVTSTTSSAYIDNVTYTTDDTGSGTYYVGGSSTAGGQYYWPVDNLDFYAYKTTVPTEVVRKAYNMFDVTPTATASDPTTLGDLVYAALSNVGKGTYGASGVPLNFKHAESKISVKLMNSQSALDFAVQAWKIVNVKNSGRFTYEHGGKTTDKATQTITNAMWADLSTSADPAAAANTTTTSYTSTFIKTMTGITAATNVDDSSNPIGSMILIPQTLTGASAYSGTTAGAAITTGAYLAVKMVIKNHTNSVVIADATTQVESKDKWAMWPLPDVTWEPGKHYIYTIDLGDGGYWELNNNGSDNILDPILDNAIIKFATVTVEGWNDNYIDVPSTDIAYNAASPSYTVGAAAGTYYFNVTGLTAGKAVEASKVTDTNGIISGVSVSPATVPSSGVVTIAVTVPASSGANSATIKLTNTTDSQDIITITINQPAAS